MCGHCCHSLQVWPRFGSSAAFSFGRFVPAPSSCNSSPPLFMGLAVWCCRSKACSMTCIGGDLAAPSSVAVVRSHFWSLFDFGSRDASCMAISSRLPLIANCPFPLCLGLAYGAVVLQHACLLASVWTGSLRLVLPPSAFLVVQLWFRIAHYLLFGNFVLIPLNARQYLPLFFRFSLWCCFTTACSMTCLCGCGAAPSFVAAIGSHFCWAVVLACVMNRVGVRIHGTQRVTSESSL